MEKKYDGKYWKEFKTQIQEYSNFFWIYCLLEVAERGQKQIKPLINLK